MINAVFAVTLTLVLGNAARAQIDCAQCTAVCAKDKSTGKKYPDDLRPEEVTARVAHKTPEAQALFVDAQRRDPTFGGSDLAGAIRSYRQAIQADGSNAQYRNYFAAALMHAGAYDEAVYNLTEAVKLVPAESKYVVNLGYAYHRQGDEMRALIQYMRALMLDPRDVRARVFAAYAMEALGLSDDAVLEFKRVLAQDPKHEGAKRGLFRLKGAAPPPMP
jgi:tetratricopeptide (TPR) repeat protein